MAFNVFWSLACVGLHRVRLCVLDMFVNGSGNGLASVSVFRRTSYDARRTKAFDIADLRSQLKLLTARLSCERFHWMPFRLPIFKDLLIFPECVARVPVSLWGSGSWGCARSSLPNRPQPFATVCNRLQPSATVHNRPQPFARSLYGRAYGISSAGGVIFGGFKRRVASFRMAGVALRDIQTCFVTCRMSFCVVVAILLRRFRKMSCSFHGTRSTLDASIVILRGRRSTFWGSKFSGSKENS